MALSTGDRLGPYEIIMPIGAGGMGEVYKARDTRLDREVAIKVLPDHLAQDPQALARFEREAKAVAALSHPNILVLYDVGAQEGVNYVVTELLEGETLRERLSRSALPWRKAAEIGVAVAEGLSAAHSKRIFHRDLKPANIFLTSDGRVKILDFGLAWRRPAPSSDEETATLTDSEAGTVMGTIGYMSPEQVRGGTVEAPSDIFSFGCVLYEMVAGRRAFSGPSPGDAMAAILKEDPPSITDSGKQVPAELVRVIERCLAKNPGERFHSAHDLAFALQGLLSVAADKPVTQPATRPPAHVRRSTLVLASVLLLAVATFFYWRNRAGQSIDSLAVVPFVNVGGNADTEYLSDGITESLIDELSEIPKLKVMSRSAVFRYKGKETDVRTIGRELGVRAVLNGRITQRGDDLSISTELVDARDSSYLWGEQYNRKLADALAVQNDIAEQISDKLRLRLSNEQKTRMAKRQTVNPEAYQLYLKGRYYAAKFDTKNLNKGLDYLRQAVALDPNYALAYSGIAYYYSLADDLSLPPAEAMSRAREAASKALELDDSVADAHVHLGNVHVWFDFNWTAAEREFQRAIELSPNYSFAHEYYGWYLVAMSRIEQGLAELRRAEELDPLSAEVSSLLGWNLYYSHRYDAAVAELRKCIDLDPNYWAGYYFLAQAYQQAGRFDDAIASLQKAREIEDQIAFPLAGLAHAYAMSGRRAEARQALDELLARSRRSHVSKYVIATVYAALGEKDQAFAMLEQAYAERSWNLIFLRLEPELDSLRSDMRFQDLLRRMNFPPLPRRG